MISNHQANPKRIGRRLQAITLCPLLIGIGLSTIITLTILYTQLQSWVSRIQDTLEIREQEHLMRIANVRSQTISSLLSNVRATKDYNNLRFLSNFYESIKNSSLQPTKKFSKAEAVSFKKYSTDPEKYSSSIVWNSPYSYDDMPGYEDLSLFLTFLKVINGNSDSQMGIILDTGLDIRFPAENITYMAYERPCNGGVFDSRCLIAYKNPKSLILSNLSLYYQYQLALMLHTASVTYTYFLPVSYFTNIENSTNDYLHLLSDRSGKITYSYNNKSLISIFGKNISTLLEKDGCEFVYSLNDTLIPKFALGSNVTEFSGYNSKYTSAFSQVLLNGESLTKLNVIIIVKESILLRKFNIFLDNIYNTVSLQVSIFLIFIAAGVLTTCILSSSIDSRITKPLSLIEAYLRGKIPYISAASYNKEVNDINKYLSIIEVIERILEPRFLLNPDTKQRLENLKEVGLLFQSIKNNKGIAITRNLIGNIYLEDEEFEKAIDSYRESLSEMENLLNEVIAQEHAESKLSYDERKMLKVKTGKETQGWEAEKANLSADIAERLHQLYHAKQMALENSLDTPYELRAEWKIILELQTKVLQYYISTSNNYLYMLKVLIDMADVYHKLQYFHTALELLDVVYEELSKLTQEYTEQAKKSSKGCTVDIDITRLKRLSLKIKDREGRKLYFQIEGVTYEKDILRQHVLYRRALIYTDNERHHEAALFFTMAIEQGTWFDPNIRRLAIDHLYTMFCKYKIIHHEPYLISMHEKFLMKKKSVVFCLCYDISNEIMINEAVVNFVSEEIQSQNEYFGAIIGNIDSKFCLDVVERDYPGLDIENVISSAVDLVDQNHIFDVIMHAIRQIPENTLEKLIVIITKGLHNNYGAARCEDLEEALQKTKVALVALDDYLPEGLFELSAKKDLTIIQAAGISASFNELRIKHFF